MSAEILHTNADNSSFDQARRSVIELCRNRGIQIKVIEGCTGGLLNHALTMPGATRVIKAGVASYSREAKRRLGIQDTLIEQYGEYSPEVAIRMAELARQDGGSLGVGVVGDLDSNNSPMGKSTVFAAYSFYNTSIISKFSIDQGSRNTMKHKASLYVLSGISSFVQGKELRLNYPFINEIDCVSTSKYDQLQEKTEQVIDICKKKQWKLGTMESCTGLLLASTFTDVPGSSHVFSEGLLAYDENVKAKLGVSFESMAVGGVYSEEVAARMAEATIANSGVDIAFATTGVMDVWDTRRYHQHTQPGTVYGAIAGRGMKTIARKLGGENGIHVTMRDDMKIAVCQEIIAMFLEDFVPQFTSENRKVFVSRSGFITETKVFSRRP